MDTLKTIIPEEDMFPPKYGEAWIAHHGFNAWGKQRWLCDNVLSKYFEPATSMAEMVKNSNWLQCEGYHGAFEEMRRQWPRCSMSINWCYNEPWKTGAGNNLIAYPSTPRPSYYYVKQAMRPTLFSARIAKFDWKAGETFEAELWLLNDAPKAVSGTVHVKATVGNEEFDLGEWTAQTDANSNKRGPTVRFTLPDIDGVNELVLTLSSDEEKSSTYTLLYRPTKKNVFVLRQLNV
jgi:beta-mannosidase